MKKKIEDKGTLLVAGLVLGIVVCCLYLFYRQALNPTGPFAIGKPYGSDLPVHIKFALEKTSHYSIYYYILRIINKLNGGLNPIGCSLFLTSLIVGTFLINKFFFRYYGFDKSAAGLLSVLLLFTASIALPAVFPFFYYTQLNTQPWHNGPYLLMRLLIFPLLIYYFKIKEGYRESFKGKDVSLFILFSVLCCLSKPSFMLAFYPVMLIGLIADLVRDGIKKIANQILFGCLAFPSLGILLYQYIASFSGITEAGEESGIVFGLGGTEPLEVVIMSTLRLIFGLAFPLYVIWSGGRKEINKTEIKTALLLYATAFLETILLHESGAREADGNFGWGMPAAAYVLMAYSLVAFFGRFHEREKWDKITGIVIASCHYLTGIVYFIVIMLGESAPALM
ncbi:MAG: hypothetical protein K5739_09110 [Lachnospiraceae bacterium]|nr:hypothetical protein [Lachnospiraceae bacterium]